MTKILRYLGGRHAWEVFTNLRIIHSYTDLLKAFNYRINHTQISLRLHDGVQLGLIKKLTDENKGKYCLTIKGIDLYQGIKEHIGDDYYDENKPKQERWHNA